MLYKHRNLRVFFTDLLIENANLIVQLAAMSKTILGKIALQSELVFKLLNLIMLRKCLDSQLVQTSGLQDVADLKLNEMELTAEGGFIIAMVEIVGFDSELSWRTTDARSFPTRSATRS